MSKPPEPEYIDPRYYQRVERPATPEERARGENYIYEDSYRGRHFQTVGSWEPLPDDDVIREGTDDKDWS